jgi:Domain of unknown function (DUF4145)
MASDPTTKQVPAPCSGCLRETKHNILHEAGWQEEDRIITYATLQCCGCSGVCLAKQVLFTDDGSKEFEYYPPPVSRKKPSWWLSLVMNSKNAYLGALLNEIYEAAHSGQNRLAAMGIRALLENLMISRIDDHGSFDKNLDKFHHDGYVSAIQRDTLSSILQMGHGAMHRSFSPKSSDLILALDIVEGVMAPIFHHHEASEKISSTVPPRPPRKKP